MTEITCPVCGKLNPAEAETCWNCLSPLSGESAPPSHPNEPDWLSGLRSDTTPAESDSANIPDWLARLRQRQEEEESAQSALLGDLGGPAESQDDGTVPDWLASLTGMPVEEPAPAAPAEETPDWLASLTSAEAPAEPGASAVEPLLTEPGEETPDWLAGLSAASEPVKPEESPFSLQPSESELPSEPAAESPDWLAGLAAEAAAGLTESPEETPPAEIPTEPSEELPDWLSRLTSTELPPEEAEVSSFAAELPPEPAEITPEWLAGLTGEAPIEPVELPEAELPAEPAAELPPEPAEITPEWLASLTGEAPTESVELPEAELPAEVAAELPPEPVEVTPEWLAGLTGEAPTESVELPEAELPAEAAAELPPEPAEITPEWLASLTGEAPSEPVELPEAELSPEPAEVTPEWLVGLTGEAPIEPVELPEAELPSEPTEITPDWLAGLATSADFEPEEPRAGEMPLDYTQLPEPGISSDVFTGEEAEELSEAGAGTGIPPEWLGSSTPPTPPAGTPTWIELFAEQPKPGEAEEMPSPETPAPFAESGAELDWLNAPPTSAEPEPPAATSLPDWLSMGEVAPEKGLAPAEGEPSPGEARPSEGLPAWLAAIAPEGVLPPEGPEPSAPAFDESASLQSTPNLTTPFEAADSTDWLSEAEHPAEEGAGAGEAVPSAPLAPALMPAWLQAMRPVEASAPTGFPEEPDNQPIEQTGPLRGLQGLLPSSRAATAYSKPAIYSSKLQVTDSQRQHTELFESLLESAAIPSFARAAAAKPSQSPLRWMIGLLLILTVLIPLLASLQQAALPLSFPPELVSAHQILSRLPDSAPILLAVEYEAGLSGEMRAAAAPVMDQLLAKDARLTLISTIPSGPVLAGQLLDAAKGTQPGYDLVSQTVNLGYLAGENTGLRQFALNPQLAAPYTLDQMPAWSAPALQNVQNLSDFAAVVVITDNFDIARNWIEQVQPSLGSTPLLMVASTQIQALVQPYAQSGQVNGLIAGLPGSSMYEQLQQKPGQTRFYWDAYQSGMLVIAVLLLLGAFYQVLTSLTRRKKPAKGR